MHIYRALCFITSFVFKFKSIFDEIDIETLTRRKDNLIERIKLAQNEILDEWSKKVDEKFDSKMCEYLLKKNDEENILCINFSQEVNMN